MKNNLILTTLISTTIAGSFILFVSCGGGGATTDSSEYSGPVSYIKFSAGANGSSKLGYVARDASSGVTTGTWEEGGTITSLYDESTVTCSFAAASASSTDSANTGIDIIYGSSPSTSSCVNAQKCILCTTSATATTCNISCAGTVPSSATVAADTFPVYLTYTTVITSSMSGAASGMIRIDGTITGWSEMDYTAQLNSPTYNSLASVYAACKTGAGASIMSVYSGSGGLVDTNSIATTSTTGFIQDPAIIANGTPPNSCTLSHQFRALMPLTGADSPGAIINYNRGSVILKSKICESHTCLE